MFKIITGVKITHSNKILFPKTGTTKLDIANYYVKAWDKIRPFLFNRPVTLVRSPSGVNKGKFYQRHPAESFPDYIDRVLVESKNHTENTYIFINELRDVLYLVNLGTIEFHPWASKVSSLDNPDYIVFDLDPGKGTTFEDVKNCAKALQKELAERKEFEPVLFKTSGKKGIHILCYLKDQYTWEDAKKLSFDIASSVVDKDSTLFTVSVRKRERVGKVFIDYLRNYKTATSVSAYSVRIWDKPSISYPFDFKDIDRIKSADQFGIEDL